MLCGFLPFDDDPTNPDSDNINQLYRYIMSTHVIFPSHVTADARDLLQKMLVPDPAKRCSVKDIMNHPWLVEYTDVLAEDTAKLESKSVAVTDSVELSNKRKTQNMIEGETVLSRKTNVPKPRDHFSPVTNEKFQDNKQRALPPSQRTNRNNFLISRAAATTTITQETIQKVPTRISKVPNFISRKPIKKEAVEPSFSTPTHRDAPNFTLGSLRMSQRRGPAADKFLSFFTGKPAQSQEHEKKEDLSTLGDSSLSLCNSSVVELPATPVSAIQHSSATEEEEEEIEIEEEEEEEEEEEINEHNVIGTSDTIMEEDSPVQITEHGHNSTCASLPSDNSLAIETRISIQEVPRRSVQVVTPEHINTPPLREITQEMTSPCSPKPVPEPSQSSRRVAVANAVTDGGRKTMAAMRRSIYRKKVPESNRVKEPVLMFAKSRFDEAQRKSLEVSSNKQGRKTGNKMMDWIKKKSHGKINMQSLLQIENINLMIFF
jgi:serine/threonine protein kinase